MTAPRKNLPPESMAYANWLEKKVLEIEQRLSSSRQDQTNTNKAQNGTTQTLAGQIQEIEAVQTEQENLLEAQQDQLDQIQAIALNQVTPAVAGNIATNFTLSTSNQQLTSVSFTVPAGFTRALVTVNASVTATSGNSGGDRLFASAAIGGNVGAEMATVLSAAAPWANLATMTAAVLTGLSGGGTFSCYVQARLQSGPGNNLVDYAQIAATVMFLK